MRGPYEDSRFGFLAIWQVKRSVVSKNFAIWRGKKAV